MGNVVPVSAGGYMHLPLYMHFCGHTNIRKTKQEMRHRFCLCQIDWENKRCHSSLLGVCVSVCVSVCSQKTEKRERDEHSFIVK